MQKSILAIIITHYCCKLESVRVGGRHVLSGIFSLWMIKCRYRASSVRESVTQGRCKCDVKQSRNVNGDVVSLCKCSIGAGQISVTDNHTAR